jgi:hypothetical protein
VGGFEVDVGDVGDAVRWNVESANDHLNDRGKGMAVTVCWRVRCPCRRQDAVRGVRCVRLDDAGTETASGAYNESGRHYGSDSRATLTRRDCGKVELHRYRAAVFAVFVA